MTNGLIYAGPCGLSHLAPNISVAILGGRRPRDLAAEKHRVEAMSSRASAVAPAWRRIG